MLPTTRKRRLLSIHPYDDPSECNYSISSTLFPPGDVNVGDYTGGSHTTEHHPVYKCDDPSDAILCIYDNFDRQSDWDIAYVATACDDVLSYGTGTTSECEARATMDPSNAVVA